MVPDAHRMLPPDFDLDRRVEDGTLHVTVSGELDLATVPQVVDAATDARPDCRSVVVDLCGVTFADSSGLRGLLQIQEHAREHERNLRMVYDPEGLGPILRVTQLDGALPLEARGRD